MLSAVLAQGLVEYGATSAGAAQSVLSTIAQRVGPFLDRQTLLVAAAVVVGGWLVWNLLLGRR